MKLIARLILLFALAVLLGAAPAHAAFPAFAGACARSNDAASTTSHPITLPGSIASGDLIFAFMFKDAQGTATIPSPWVEIKDEVIPTAHLYVAYLIASGGETTVTVTSSVSEKATNIACRITAASWHGATPPEISTSVTGLNTTPNPDSVTASWGSADNLFIAVSSQDINGDVTAFPANYTDNQTVSTPAGCSCGQGGIATRNLAAASDDPGTFTIDVNEDWRAATIVVRPAAGGGGGTALPPTQMMQGVGD